MRLKTLLAAAAMSIGLLAHAEGEVTLPNGTSFEDQQVGKISVSSLTDATWTYAGDQQDIMAYAGGDDYQGARPAQFSTSGQEKYLKVTTPLTNGVKRTIAAQTIDETKGFYVDTLVKFTAADDDLDIPTDGKVAVWVKAMDEDGLVNHLMVTAGPLDDQDKPKTYDCGTISNLDAWHRLTIKVIKTVTGDKLLNGVVVYLDGDQDAAARVGAGVAEYWQGAGVTLSANANEFAKNGQLFPAMSSLETISELEFAGQGSIDDISLTDVAPAFAKDFQFYTVAWEKGVTGFTYTPYEADPVVKSGLTDEGSVTVVWDGENAPEIDEQSITVAEGKVFKEIDTTVDATATIKVTDLVATGVIDDKPASFASVEDMLTAINGATTSASVTLGNDINESLAISSAATVVIDLAGKTITASEGAAAISVSAGTLYITNSTDKVGVVDGNGYAAVEDTMSDGVYMQAGKFIGAVANDITYDFCTGGKYTVEGNSENDGQGGLTCLLSLGQNKDVKIVTEGDVDFYEVIEAAPAATATVIFVCEKTGYNDQKTVTAGETFSDTPDVSTTVGDKKFYTVTAWKDGEGNAFAPFTPAADQEYTFYADLDINLTQVDDEYQVTQAADLVTLKDYVADGNGCAGKTFKQTADINFADVVVDGGWDGIGTDANKFAGTFDGDEYKFTGTLALARKSYGGLFGDCNGATIKNVTFDSTVVLAPPALPEPPPEKIGSAGYAVIGRAGDNTSMINITMSGKIGTEANPCNHNVAGIAVSSAKNALFENCVMDGELYTTGPNNDHVKAGGMVAICSTGDNATYTTFKGCTVSGKISNKTEYTAAKPDDLATAGALCGYSNSGIKVIDNCDVSGVTFDVTAADEWASVDCGMFFGYCSDKFEVTNTTAKADIIAVGSHFNANNAKQLWLATINSDDKAVYDAANETPDLAGETTYKVMLPCASFTLAEGQKIALDETVAAATVTAADTEKDEIKHEGNLYECVAKATEPIPPMDDPKQEDIAKVFEKAADTTLATKVTPENYSAFRSWSQSIGEGGAAGEAAVLASSKAFVSFEMSAVAEAHLFTNDPEIKVTETTVGDTWTATVKVMDGEQLVKAVEAIANQVKVSEDLATWGAATATATITEGVATITITKPGETKGFMKVNAAK